MKHSSPHNLFSKFSTGHIAILTVLLLAALEFSCRRSNDMPAVAVNEATQPLDSLFGSIFDSPDGPGATIIVMRGDTVIYNRSFGRARLDRDLPMSDHVYLNLVSASKAFITSSILKLREQGRLSLNDTIGNYFPQINTPALQQVTLRHVLSQTSGLPDLLPRNESEWKEYIREFPTAFAQNSDFRRFASDGELTKYFRKLDTLATTPGSTFNYQDAPYLLLPRVVEAVTDTSFQEWVRVNIFEPAGLREVQFFTPDSVDAPLMAQAYRPFEGNRTDGTFVSEDGKWEEFDYGESDFFGTTADHGVFATPREFVKWIRALYTGKVIKPSSLRLSTSVATETPWENIQYGLGVYVQDVPTMPYKSFHSSSNGGFSIYEAVFPRQDLNYAIMSNRIGWDRLGTAEKVDSILRSTGILQERQPD